MQEGSLIHDGENDYTLADCEVSCWITVDNISVYVMRTDEGVAVDLFPVGLEADGAITSTYAYYDEAEGLIDDYEYQTRNQRQGTEPDSDVPGAQRKDNPDGVEEGTD